MVSLEAISVWGGKSLLRHFSLNCLNQLHKVFRMNPTILYTNNYLFILPSNKEKKGTSGAKFLNMTLYIGVIIEDR